MALKDLQADLTLVLDKLTAICEDHGYDATPVVLLIHRDGSDSSILMGEADRDEIVGCVESLFAKGDKSEMSIEEAIFKSHFGV